VLGVAAEVVGDGVTDTRGARPARPRGRTRRGVTDVLAGLLAVSVLAAAGCSGGDGGGGGPAASPPAAAGAQLQDVAGVLDLRAAFNADEGRPRLLLLLSPT
jgi:hypothetical protein